jgi:hypothetical protein
VVCVWHADCQQRHGRLLAVQLHSLQAWLQHSCRCHTLHATPYSGCLVCATHRQFTEESYMVHCAYDRPFCNIKFFNEKITRRINKGRHATVSMFKPIFNCTMAEVSCSAVCWLHR